MDATHPNMLEKTIPVEVFDLGTTDHGGLCDNKIVGVFVSLSEARSQVALFLGRSTLTGKWREKKYQGLPDSPGLGLMERH